jgi:hypothetical protein
VGLILFVVLAATRAGADTWPRFEGPGITVEAPPRFAHFARGLVRDHARRMAEVEARLGLAPPARVVITVAPDVASLAVRLGVELPPWAAGVALKGRGRIGLNAAALGPPLSLPPPVVVRHELTHLAIGGHVGPDARVPRWLEEGICQWVGGDAYLGLRRDLMDNLDFDRLIDWSALGNRFPSDRLRAGLAYQQSFAFVRYLADRFGAPLLLRLVDAAAAGTPVHRALLEETGQPQIELQQAWMQFERDRTNRMLYLLQGATPLAFGALLLAMAWRRRARLARDLLRRMEEDERGPGLEDAADPDASHPLNPYRDHRAP